MMDLIRTRNQQALRDGSTYLMLFMTLAAVFAMGVLVSHQMWRGRSENRLIPMQEQAPKSKSPKLLTA